MTLKYLIQKELLQIRRNSFLPKLIVVFPIMIMLVMPWVMNLEVKNIKVVVVDHDRSTLSGRLVHRIEASDYFIFCGMRPSYEAALTDIEESRTDVIVEIPRHYSRDAMTGNVPCTLIAANAVNGTSGSIGASYLANIVVQNLSELAASKGMSVSASNAVKVSTLYLYNNHLNYKVFMIPALMAILLMLLCGFLPALNIVGEKEAGTIEQINVTPVGKATFIFSKLIPYWGIAILVLTVCFVLAWLVYGITPVGNLGLIYLVAMLLALTASGFGLIISNYSDTLQQAMYVMFFFMVCMILLSGLFTPVRSMPDWAQNLTLINPLRHFIEAMRTVFVRGGTFDSITTQVAALTAFAIVMDVWAVISYKKNS